MSCSLPDASSYHKRLLKWLPELGCELKQPPKKDGDPVTIIDLIIHYFDYSFMRHADHHFVLSKQLLQYHSPAPTSISVWLTDKVNNELSLITKETDGSYRIMEYNLDHGKFKKYLYVK